MIDDTDVGSNLPPVNVTHDPPRSDDPSAAKKPAGPVRSERSPCDHGEGTDYTVERDEAGELVRVVCVCGVVLGD